MKLVDFLHLMQKKRDDLNFFIGKFLFDKKKTLCTTPVQVSSILFIRGDGKIGDGVVSSFIYRELKRSQPNIQIGVLCTPATINLYSKNQYINMTHAYPKRPKVWEVNALIKSVPKYDAVVFLGENLKTRDFKLLATLNSKYTIGIASNVSLININIQNKVTNHHYQQYFCEIAKTIGITPADLSYEFLIPDEVERQVTTYLKNTIEMPYIAINGFGNANCRCFSTARFIEIIKAIRAKYSMPIVLLSYPKICEQINKIITESRVVNIYVMPETISIEQNAILIKKAKLFISVDTATVHIANAMKTPLIAIYRNDIHLFNKWNPNFEPSISIFTRKAKNDVEEVNIGSFELPELMESISKLL